VVLVFAGVLTYEAIRITGCSNSADGDDGGSCSSGNDEGDDKTSDCHRLWGLIKPDSLLTMLATTAAIILAFSSMFFGTSMEVTPYRRQIGRFGTSMCVVGMAFCVTIIVPNETTLAICSIGLIIHYVFKDYHFIVIESYTPELSHIPKEVATYLSVGGVWFYSSEVVTVVIWVIVGFFIGGPLYGLVVTIVSVIMVGVMIPVAYNRLPDVPTNHQLSLDQSIFKYTLSRQKALIMEVYDKYPDYGIILLSNMIYSPALDGIFIAAVQILVSKFHFTASEIPIILGCGLISAVIGAYLSRFVSKMHCTSSTVADPRYPSPTQEECHDPPSEEEEGENGASRSDKLGAVVNDIELEVGGCVHTMDAVTADMLLHPRRMQMSILGGLVAVSIVTVCGTFMMRPCDLGMACLFGVLWGITLSFCWTCGNMLRSALVPGGAEAEFAGLLLTTGNACGWVPLMVFSVANEVWTIEGAMLTLLAFFAVGGCVLCTIDMKRAVMTTLNSLGQRRWANEDAKEWQQVAKSVEMVADNIKQQESAI
jgi:MFS-type transporter involved in bile tolerance (Atg22 family)